ncbi:bacteriocin fulvocin C-related protein [Alistipes intestinihominis]|uniref:Bacteriocin fulvocin C-related protein n=1 Tax=Alistipes intestinihominis TaxID=3133172 RepID=A0ABV1GV11_9BACT
MKKNLFKVGITLCLFLSACQNEQLYYSCDPIKDQWVKANLEEIGNMTCGEWLDLNIDYAKPAYAALKPDTRYEIWNQKINQVLTFDWTEKEQTHIESVKYFISHNREMFEDKAVDDDIIYTKVSTFLYKWYEYGKDELGWNTELMASIITDAHPLKNKAGELEVKINGVNTIATRSETRLDCNCNTTSIWYADCEATDCRETATGCGGLTFFSCNGRHRP